VLFDHLLLSVKRLRIPMHNIKIHSSYYPWNDYEFLCIISKFVHITKFETRQCCRP
jgi:hypothetical protein